MDINVKNGSNSNIVYILSFIHKARAALCLYTLIGLTAQPVMAHSRWFIDPTEVVPNVGYKLDLIYFLVLLSAGIFSCLALWLAHLTKRSNSLAYYLNNPWNLAYQIDWRILSILVGFVLVANSMMHVWIAPNLHVTDCFSTRTLLFVQILIGSMLILQTYISLAAIVLIALPIACLVQFKPVLMIDYMFELFTVGLVLLYMAPSLSLTDRALHNAVRLRLPFHLRARFNFLLRSYPSRWSGDQLKKEFASRDLESIDLLRFGIGMQFIQLAIFEKGLNPGLVLAFVNKNSFVNFMPALGFEYFSNLHFVFMAGIFEFTFGALLVANISVRLVASVLAAIFTLTGVVFGLEELLGHIPILTILLMLILRGDGKVVRCKVTAQEHKLLEIQNGMSTHYSI